MRIYSEPHVCPVCHGVGSLPHGFYTLPEGGTSTDMKREECRSCVKGVIYVMVTETGPMDWQLPAPRAPGT